MATTPKSEYPGGSKSRVNRAGDAVRSGRASVDDLQVIEEWRAAHRGVLNTFQAILRNRTRGTRIAVAQRHKRRRTIFDKLRRYPDMQLSRMDDIAGCRLIFSSVRQLSSFRRKFHKARFNHRRRNEPDKYDYIKKPKPTGYRGIHDVYVYDVNSNVGRRLAGLYVEIQYRTRVQHAWATAVEVIGYITESQPKFQKGDKRYEHVMALASDVLARAFEESKGPFGSQSDEQIVREFYALDEQLSLLNTLRGINAADRFVGSGRNVILMFTDPSDLEVFTYRDATDALKDLFDFEKKYPERDIVLVRADTSEEVRVAFKNYFSDARDFIDLVASGCKKLAPQVKRPPRHKSSQSEVTEVASS